MAKYQGGLTEAPAIGAYLPQHSDGPARTPCPSCDGIAIVVWRPGGAFQQRTECACGRKTRWVMCGHDAEPDTTDDESR
jgi:hypothetical protein